MATGSDSLLASIDTRKRADQVRDSIVNLIRERNLEPGAKLPTERELMEGLGVGRSSVREALNSLAGLGVVEARPGRGFYLSRLSVKDVTRVLSGALHLETQVSWRLVEARSVIELAAGRLAAERHTPEDIHRMEEANEQIRVAFSENDLDAIVEADATFHLAMVQASHNDVLVEMLRSIEPWLVQQRKELFRRQIEGSTYNYDTAVGTHEALLQTIRAGDANGTEAALRIHLQSIWEQVRIWPLT